MTDEQIEPNEPTMDEELDACYKVNTALRQTIAEKDVEIERLKHWLSLGLLTVAIANGKALKASPKGLDDNPVNCISWIMIERDLARAESVAAALQVEEMRKALEEAIRRTNNYPFCGCCGTRTDCMNPVHVADCPANALSSTPSATLAQVRSALEGSIAMLKESKKQLLERNGLCRDSDNDVAIKINLTLPAAQSALALIGGTK